MMNEKRWTGRHSLLLSQVMVWFFFILLVLCDVTGYWLVNWLCANVIGNRGLFGGMVLLGTMYLCSIPAYVTLWDLRRLLRNMGREQVFVPQNVASLRRISWCCVLVALVCLVAAVVEWPSLGIVTLAAGFMALIVRVVKNVFDEAITMKDELDLTV